MKKIFVVIINYKGEKNTKELLESLKGVKRDGLDLNVLVIDNYPKDPIKISEKDYADLKLKLILNKNNLGFSGGNNVGIKYSLENGADYLLFINNDTLVDPGFIENLVATAEKDQKNGIVVPKIYFAKGYEFHKDKYKKEDLGKVIWYAGGEIDWNNVVGKHRGVDEVDHGQFDESGETKLATGCCLLIRRQVLEKVKGYDENYFLYYEDADLSERVRRLNYKIVYEPKAVVWHKNAQSTGGSGSEIQDYFTTRNRMLFGNRYAPLRTRAALARESMRLISSGRIWQRYGIKDYYLHRFGKGRMDL